VRDAINYEGQAAIELEQRADPSEEGAYPAAVEACAGGGGGQRDGGLRAADAGPMRVHAADLVRAAAEDLVAGTAPAVIAARFHRGVAAAGRGGDLVEDGGHPAPGRVPHRPHPGRGGEQAGDHAVHRRGVRGQVGFETIPAAFLDHARQVADAILYEGYLL
jgi:hypothetical protein